MVALGYSSTVSGHPCTLCDPSCLLLWTWAMVWKEWKGVWGRRLSRTRLARFTFYPPPHYILYQYSCWVNGATTQVWNPVGGGVAASRARVWRLLAILSFEIHKHVYDSRRTLKILRELNSKNVFVDAQRFPYKFLQVLTSFIVRNELALRVSKLF